MHNIQSHTTCGNPACGQQIDRRDAFLRSVSLEQRAFCSQSCVDVFTQLDQAVRRTPVPQQQRRPITGRVR